MSTHVLARRIDLRPARHLNRIALLAPVLYLVLLIGLNRFLLVTATSQQWAYLLPLAWTRTITLLLVQLLAGLLVFAWLHQRNRSLWGAADLPGYGFHRTNRHWLMLGEVWGLVLAIIAGLIAWLLPRPVAEAAPFASLSLPITGGMAIWTGTAISVLLAPIFEEGVFRGALLGALSGPMGKRGAIIISTLLFAGLHFPEQSGYWFGLLPIAALGWTAAELRIRSGSLLPAIVAHIFFNALVGFGALH